MGNIFCFIPWVCQKCKYIFQTHSGHQLTDTTCTEMVRNLFVVICIPFCIPLTSAQWSNYLLCSQLCMSNAQLSSGCPINNACLCSNTGNFFGKASACALQECDNANFDSTYSTLVSNCNESGQAVDYSLLQFQSAGEELLSPSSQPTSSAITTSTTPKPTTRSTLSATLQLTGDSSVAAPTLWVTILQYLPAQARLTHS
jgi:hypothetical protein